MVQGPNQPKATCFWKLSFIVTHLCTGAEAELPNDGASLGFFLDHRGPKPFNRLSLKTSALRIGNEKREKTEAAPLLLTRQTRRQNSQTKVTKSNIPVSMDMGARWPGTHPLPGEAEMSPACGSGVWCLSF